MKAIKRVLFNQDSIIIEREPLDWSYSRSLLHFWAAKRYLDDFPEPTFSRRLRSSERSRLTSSSASSYQRLTVRRMSIVSDFALKFKFKFYFRSNYFEVSASSECPNFWTRTPRFSAAWWTICRVALEADQPSRSNCLLEADQILLPLSL